MASEASPTAEQIFEQTNKGLQQCFEKEKNSLQIAFQHNEAARRKKEYRASGKNIKNFGVYKSRQKLFLICGIETAEK